MTLSASELHSNLSRTLFLLGSKLFGVLCLWGCLASAWAGAPAAEPPNLGALKTQLKEYHDQAYSQNISAVLSEAQDWIRKRASHAGKPAIVLDVDETSLSNWEEILVDDFAYIAKGTCTIPPQMPCASPAWEQLAQATAIEPTLRTYEEARRLNVAVFFVTGRLEDPVERSATELNLWRVGYHGWEKLYMRPDHNGTVSQYKTSARESIEAQGYTIIANVGDQLSDLAGGHAEKTFKVPNPFYFIP